MILQSTGQAKHLSINGVKHRLFADAENPELETGDYKLRIDGKSLGWLSVDTDGKLLVTEDYDIKNDLTIVRIEVE